MPNSMIFKSLLMLLSLSGGVFLSMLISSGRARFAFIFFMLPTLILIFRPYLNEKNIIKLLVIASFFPVQINASTTNLGPTSQYLILGSFALYAISLLSGKYRINFTRNIIVVSGGLLVVAVISTASTWGNFEVFRTSFWAVIVLMACLAFLLLVDALTFSNKEEQVEFIYQVLDLVVLLTCVQIIIGAMVYFKPETSEYLSIFYSNNTDKFLQATLTDFGILRLRTVVLTVESLGEFIAVLMPYVLYRLSGKMNLLYVAYTIILFAGLVLSVTRSGILLTLFVVVIYTLLIESSFKKKSATILIVFIAIGGVIYFDFGVTSVLHRFSIAYDAYLRGDDALIVSNRSFFRYNITYFIKNISLFGNGLVSPLKYNILTIDFHNLYLTIIFQYGVIGASLYFLIPILLIKRLWLITKSKYPENLHIVFLLSIACFFINEFKYEYTREQSGVLIIWIVFSMYFLLTKKSFSTDVSISS